MKMSIAVTGALCAAAVTTAAFAAKPTTKVPYLAGPVRLNGELSDWPAAAKVPGIRATACVGWERCKLPEPNVYLGWNEAGLFIGLEVFDNDVATAPPTGWWSASPPR